MNNISIDKLSIFIFVVYFRYFFIYKFKIFFFYVVVFVCSFFVNILWDLCIDIFCILK